MSTDVWPINWNQNSLASGIYMNSPEAMCKSDGEMFTESSQICKFKI